MRVISLGWGVQSFTLAAMAALGDIEPVGYAIHADTTHESKLTYEFADRWRWWLHDKGVRVITVKPDAKKLRAFNNHEGVYIPAYTYKPSEMVISDGWVGDYDDNGEKIIDADFAGTPLYKPDSYGQLNRQCTGDWKIAPMRRWLQQNRDGEPVEMLLGISLDEFQRMKQSDVKYITNVFPLVDKRMTRFDCMKYLDNLGIEVPPRSACTFCPYHNTAEWNRIKSVPEDWDSAVELDKAIRKIRPPYDLFIHPSVKPIDEVDFRSAEEKGQMTLWDNECSGVCGV